MLALHVQMDIRVNLKRFIPIIFCSSSVLATPINWIESTLMDDNSVFICTEVTDYIESLDVENLYGVSLWELDVNGDNNRDFIVTFESRDYCGSSGCTSALFVKEGEFCKVVDFPHLTPGQEIGFDGVNIYLNDRSCHIWKFDKSELKHVMNKEKCE